MALSNAEYTAIHNKTGDDLAKLKTIHDEGVHSTLVIDNPGDHPVLTSILYQMQKMQDELDYLRTEISSNKDKVSMTLGTSGSTALAGNTTTISTAQANAITANTAKTSMTLGTSGSTALAGDTTTISTTQANEITASTTLGSKLNVVTRVADANKSTAITFGEFTTTVSGKTTTYSLPITVVETDTSGKSTVTTTKTATLTLT